MSVLSPFITSIKSGHRIPVLILSEEDVLHLIHHFSQRELDTWDALVHEVIPGVHIYEKDEEKKEFSIEKVRTFLSDIALSEYVRPAFYILKDIDLASLSAMNALLKIFEDRPEWTVILCTATRHESLLETIRSRVIVVSLNQESTTPLWDDLLQAIEDFTRGNRTPLLLTLFHEAFERSEALAIMNHYYKHKKQAMSLSELELYEKIVEAITLSNEPTRNLLDVFFLSQES